MDALTFMGLWFARETHLHILEMRAIRLAQKQLLLDPGSMFLVMLRYSSTVVS